MKLSNTIIINETLLPNNKKAFTLAETLITLTILGIVAVIVVPSLINRQVENANRTKVKKAMAAYEKAINMMTIENDLKTTETLKTYGEEETCKYTRAYFKTVQNGANNCIFKTADKVWWDITDITNPIISLKDEITNSNKAAIRTNAMNYDADKVSFALIGRYDNVGTLRVDDNGFERSLENNDNNKNYMTKLWSFINNISPGIPGDIANGTGEPLTGFAKCNAEGATTCVITVNGVDTTYTKITTNADTIHHVTCIYDRNSNPTKTCNGYDSIASAGDYWISEILASTTEEEAKDMTNSVCTNINCHGDYYEAAKRKCEAQGAHLGTLAELIIARNNGKTTKGFFLASEEADNDIAYGIINKFGDSNVTYKYNAGPYVICVGNNN